MTLIACPESPRNTPVVRGTHEIFGLSDRVENVADAFGLNLPASGKLFMRCGEDPVGQDPDQKALTDAGVRLKDLLKKYS